MKNERFVVRYTSEKTCYAYLPDHAFGRHKLKKQNVIQMLHKDKTSYVSCYLKNSTSGNVIFFNSLFATSLGISEKEEVFISLVEDYIPNLKSIHVKANTDQDREIIELHFERVQWSLLSQINVVGVNQPIIVWVSKFYSATLIIESLNPDFNYGFLVEDTEVHIDNSSMKSQTQAKPVNSETNSNFPPKNWSQYKTANSTIFRGIVLPSLSRQSPFHIFIKKSDACKTVLNSLQDKKYLFCKVSKLTENADEKNIQILNKTSLKFSQADSLYVRLYAIDESNTYEIEEWPSKERFTEASVFLNVELSMNLKMKSGGKLKVEILEPLANLENISSLEVYKVEGELNLNDLENYVENRSKGEDLLLLNSKSYLKLENGGICLLKILPITCPYGLFDVGRFKRLKVNLHKNDYHAENLNEFVKVVNGEMKNVYMSGINTMINECLVSLTLKSKVPDCKSIGYRCDNVLICGTTGSGKTTFCKVLKQRLNSFPYYVHTAMINCTAMKGKKAEIIQKVLTTVITECVYYQSSVLFLDNLDCITKYNLNQDELNMDSINAARISELIFEMMTEAQSLHNVSLVATCLDYNSVGEKLRTVQGNHFFRTVLTIPELEKKDRTEITKQFCKFKTNVAEEIDWEKFGNLSHGWVYQDFAIFTDKAAFVAWKRTVKAENKGQVCIEECDLTDALANFSPLSLHDVKLSKNGNINWSEIGGLGNVKRTLTEILHWPLKYHNLFKHAPIKQQSGILLYGMPGTGKTMLASAISKEFGLNLISVKGPELLSKYIGASEEAVRNVFEKAQIAKPCVIFFDEFDSLAPRRGHDNTGVTDRVVNQLLTQLDGVEGREGVAIVAATSRPDLIDPAILRPGRLDKIVHCPIPEDIDREEILTILSEANNLDIDAETLKELVSLTKGYTGADLNVIFKQAKMNLLQKTPRDKLQVQGFCLTVDDVFESLKSTKPSISSMEKKRFLNIYDKFSNKGNLQKSLGKRQKATLA